MPPRISDEKLAIIIRLKKEGLQIGKIASITGVHRVTIHRYLHPNPPPPPSTKKKKNQLEQSCQIDKNGI